MHFVPAGGEQMRQLLAAILVWRQQTRGESIAVDTQTTDAGGDGSQPAAGVQPDDAWVPPVGTEQWTGSIPSSSVQPASPDGDPFEPTDADLVQALEEFERREQEEALQSSGGDPAADQPAAAELSGGETSEPEHHRRRVLSSLFDRGGNPES